MPKSYIATMPPVAPLYGSVPMYCKVLEPCGREGRNEGERMSSVVEESLENGAANKKRL